MKVAVSGASGMIGTALRESLVADGVDVLALTRRKSLPPLETVTWDLEKGRFDASPLEGTDVVVHLAGEPIAQRWTESAKKAIRESRSEGTRLLVEGLKSLENKPKVLVSASAVGFYGDGGDEVLTESSPAGEGFLPEVCQAWEQTAMEAMGLGIRTVVLRTGVVLSTKGGALAQMMTPFKLGVGGRVGHGRQWMSWIHIDDLVGAMRFVTTSDELMGAVNATAPHPVRNAEFTKSLGAALHRPTIFPVPAFGLKLAFGEMSQVLLESQRVLPKKLEEAGYVFHHPEIGPALEDVIEARK